MANSTDKATFDINLGGNAEASATKISAAMEELRSRIAKSTSTLKEHQEALKAIKGPAEEIKKQKDELREKINAERTAMSAAKGELSNQAKAYKKVSAETKKLAADKKKKLADAQAKEKKDAAEKRTQGLVAALKNANGPIGALTKRVLDLKEKLGGDNASGLSAATGLASMGADALATAALAAVAAVAALSVAVAAAGVSLAKFIIQGADAARSAALLREAAFGANPQWGKNFGEQVAALAMKVPTAKADLDKLGIALAKNNIGGQLWVDTMNAVAQASAALGDDAGNKIKEFVERGRLLNRMQLNPMELIGTGVTFDEVAGQLAKSMRVGVNDAKQALFEGRVKLGDGAAAIRAAVEKKFGALNLRQMLSLPNIAKKFGEALDALTAGVDLEPMLNAIKDIGKAFGLNTVAGDSLKKLVTDIGDGLVKTFVESAPLIKKFGYGMIIAALKIELAFLQLRKRFRQTFGDSEVLKNVDVLSVALKTGEYAVYGIGAAFIALGAVVAAAVGPFVAIWAGMMAISEASQALGTRFRETFTDVDWAATGKALVDGLVNGIKSGIARVENAVGELGTAAKNKLKAVLDIHSPSKVFANLGEQTSAGYAAGVAKGAPAAGDAVAAMAAPPDAGPALPAARSMSITVPVTIQITAGKDAQSIADAVSSQAVIEQITKAVVDAAHAMGAPVPA